MQYTYYTTDYEPLQPTNCVAFTSANNDVEARTKLRPAIIAAGCRDPGPDFEVTRLESGCFVINGDY